MKKLISIIISLVLLCSLGMYSVNATGDNVENLYEDLLLDTYLFYPVDGYTYEEVYYNRGDNGEIDWAIIRADIPSISESVVVNGVIGGKYVYLPSPEYPFTIGYGLYDAKENIFYDIWNNTLFEKYDGLYDAFNSLDLSSISPQVQLGDANADMDVNIIDATHIRRYLASLIDKSEIVATAADADKDGKVSIIDATLIQMKLAKLDVPVATPDEV